MTHGLGRGDHRVLREAVGIPQDRRIELIRCEEIVGNRRPESVSRKLWERRAHRGDCTLAGKKIPPKFVRTGADRRDDPYSGYRDVLHRA